MRPGMSLTGVRYQIGWCRSLKAWVRKLANRERNFCRNVQPVRHGTFSDSPDNGLRRHIAWFSTKKSVAIIERCPNHRTKCAKI